MKKEKKLINIRAFAILSVVLGHSIIIYSNSWDLYETLHKVSLLNNIKKIIGFYQMPLFISLAGYLFYYTCSKKRELWTFVKDKILRLLLPFLAVSILWLTPIKMLVKVPGFTNGNFFEIILEKTFLLKSTGHLWYLIALFIIFMIYFIINKIFDLTKKDRRGIILDACIFLVTLLFIDKYTNIKEVLPQTALHRVFAYLFWFYFGFCICKYLGLGKKEDTHHDWWVPFLCLLTGGLVVLGLTKKGQILTFITKMLIVICAYLITPTKTNKITEFLDRNSMGMFLFHSPLIYISFTYWPNIHPILMVFINFVIFGLLAALITEVIRKTRFKWIIGEKK